MMDPLRDERDQEDEPTAPEMPALGTPIGVGAYVELSEEGDLDNDQENHVSPSDNDGETIPQDEVAEA
jgi:hypothetical protein